MRKKVCMGMMRRQLVQEQAKRDVALLIALKAGAVEECEFHPDRYVDMSDRETLTRAYRMANWLFSWRNAAVAIFATKRELTEAIKNVVEKSLFDCPDCLDVAVHREKGNSRAFAQRLKEVATMNEVIARLKKEKAETKQRDYEMGKRDGREWAKNDDYDEVEYLVQNRSTVESTVAAGFGFFYYNFQDMHEELQDAGVVNLDDWDTGWYDGVTEFWQEVNSKL